MLELTTIILAAGQGVRMRSLKPKVLHPLCGRPMIDYTLETAMALNGGRVVVVAPNGPGNPVEAHVRRMKGVRVVRQAAPKGTGNAVLSCEKQLGRFPGYVLILNGDTPLIRPETLRSFCEKVGALKPAVAFVSTNLKNPNGFGRVLRDGHGDILGVVEEKEATPEQKAIHEINTGIFLVKRDWLFNTLKKLKPHGSEYYLPDIIHQAVEEGAHILGYLGEDAGEYAGVNSQKLLGEAEAILRARLAERWMERGVKFVDPAQVYLEPDVTIGQDTVIHPQVHLRGQTRIGKGCVVECGSVLTDMRVADGVHIKPYCVLEESTVAKGAKIGPFARLRPLSKVGPGCSVGNFVELKKTVLGKGVKANHLSYLGDAFVGEGSNVGCGTITCNYDGVHKHPTRIGKKVFVGSDVQFIAPVTVGQGAYIAAGSTITENVPAGALGVARGRQVNKRGWVSRRQKGKRKK